MTDTTPRPTSLISRSFTRPHESVWDTVVWARRDATILEGDKVIFEQKNVEFPSHWSQGSIKITAQKYFRGRMDDPAREYSVKQMVGRVAKTITNWGVEQGYFDARLPGEYVKDREWGDEALAFYDELTYILLHQFAAFNSPVWFNVGFEEHPQCHACFINGIKDTLKGEDGINDWITKETAIFAGGSGSGIDLSPLRGSMEPLSKGGFASGPVSFMRAADANAGTISSGGKTRRAAKMVSLLVDHPDIRDFIWCKALEEDRLEAMERAGLIKGIDERGAYGSYQNANNSVRVTDDFMKLVEARTVGDNWALRKRGHHDGTHSGEVAELLNAFGLWLEIAKAAWRCADPGIQYHTTINSMNTSPATGPITASNPCSEYMHIDDSACNLASLNVLKFMKDDGTFHTAHIQHVTDVMTLAMDILIDAASYPTEKIKRNAHRHRQLGLGHCNGGAALMRAGVPYDSKRGRDLLGAFTAIVGGRSYRMSAHIAEKMEPYEAWSDSKDGVSNSAAHLTVMDKHRDSVMDLVASCDEQSEEYRLALTALEDWHDAIDAGQKFGYRNAQATVLAPTGTISFLMDCDTTGIEPDWSLLKIKDLAGGGQETIVNKQVGPALKNLGYATHEIAEALQTLNSSVAEFMEWLDPPERPVFHTANDISVEGHIGMMAACQPYLSGAISKTVNMPEDSTPEDIADTYLLGWKSGLKALAIYRDGSKGTQPLNNKTDPSPSEASPRPTRRRLPATRSGDTHKANVAGTEFYITLNRYEDGTLGEMFLTGIGKEGSITRGSMNAWATTFSVLLQDGHELEDILEKYIGQTFEPRGITTNPEIPFCTSMVDYIGKYIASRYASDEFCHEHGVQTEGAKLIAKQQTALIQEHEVPSMPTKVTRALSLAGPPCEKCQTPMQRTGTCFTCPNCFENTGCG
jgi:ribonucleoside-diphosphate reductase alpha chain